MNLKNNRHTTHLGNSEVPVINCENGTSLKINVIWKWSRQNGPLKRRATLSCTRQIIRQKINDENIKNDTNINKLESKKTDIGSFLTLFFPGKRARGKGCFQVETEHIKMETSLRSLQQTARSTDNLEQERPVHQTAPGDNGMQTASKSQWNSPVRSEGV